MPGQVEEPPTAGDEPVVAVERVVAVEPAGSGRIQYLDVLRVLSMLSVVFLHTVAGSLRANYGSSAWHFSNALTSLASPAVPLFFMISGALLLDSPKTLSIEYTLKKRLPRVLVPFVVWSLIAIAYHVFVSWRVNGSPDLTTAVDKLKNFPAQPTSLPLWFMYALIPLYILSPLIKKLTDSLSRNLAIYLVVIWLAFTSLLPTLAAFLPERYRPIAVLNSLYDLSFMAGYAGYFVIGYYLMRYSGKVSKKLLIAVIVVDAAVITLGTWWRTDALGAYSELFKGYTRIFTLILSIAIFLLAKELLKERTLKGALWATISFLVPVSFGVYLAHALVIDLMSRLVSWWPAGSVGVVCLSYIVVLAVSMVCITLLAGIKPFCFAFTGQRYRGWRKLLRPRG